MKFSASTGCFYPPNIQYPSLPVDLIDCPQADYEAAMARKSGETLSVVNGKLVIVAAPVPTAAEVLAQAQAVQMAVLFAAYESAISASLPYTSKAGAAKTYQADEASVANLSKMLLAFAGGTVPAGFAWLSEDNTAVPFVYADLQGLAAAIGTQAYAAFGRLQVRKGVVRAATTVAAVQGVTW